MAATLDPMSRALIGLEVTKIITAELSKQQQNQNEMMEAFEWPSGPGADAIHKVVAGRVLEAAADSLRRDYDDDQRSLSCQVRHRWK